MYQIEPKITKEYILNRCSEEQIFSYYFGHKVQLKKKYINQLRIDKTPSCEYKYSKSGVLYFIDYAMSCKYDCFEIVIKMYNISFIESLIKIKNDLIGKINCNIDYKKQELIVFNKRGIEITSKIIDIKVKKENWNDNYLKYWLDYYISKDILLLYNVSPISYYWINDKIIETKLAYCYYLGFDIKHKYKILNLKSTSYKWITNCVFDIQGYSQLPQIGDLLIITKSLKDSMVLYFLGFNSVSVQSESVQLTNDQFLDLNKRFKKIILFYDNDKAGLTNSHKSSIKFNILQIRIPICEKIKNNVKDISDYIKKYGINKTKNLLNTLLCQI